MMGFIRKQEENLAIRLLTWHYQRTGQELPSPTELSAQAEKLVCDAHRIARQRGSNVVSILKDLVADLRR